VIKRKTSLRDKILSRKVAGKKQVPKALVEAVAEMERLYKDFAGTKNDKAVSIKLAGLLGVSPLDLEEMSADEFDEWVRAYIESNRAAAIETPPPPDNAVAIVGKKFLKVLKSKLTQNRKADSISSQVTEDEWNSFKQARRIGSGKRDYFLKLIRDCDRKKEPKWLESFE
jgi:hypothetical protein